jgi:hypothetical protein
MFKINMPFDETKMKISIKIFTLQKKKGTVLQHEKNSLNIFYVL